METSVKRTGFIRLGGVAAMVGGALYVSLAFLWPLLWELWPLPEWPLVFMPLGSLFLELGAMAAIAAIAALSVLEVERWRLPWILMASLVAFVGLALILVSLRVGFGEGYAGGSYEERLFFVGLQASTLGLLLLAILVIAFRVLPWWGGVALIVGIPSLGMLLGPLTGVVWAVVGYAIFRAAGRRTERPPRVR